MVELKQQAMCVIDGFTLPEPYKMLLFVQKPKAKSQVPSTKFLLSSARRNFIKVSYDEALTRDGNKFVHVNSFFLSEIFLLC